MPLNLITSPIGDPQDLSLRALDRLRTTEILIGEEAKILRRRLSVWGINPRSKKIYSLNEHSDSNHVEDLVQICENHEVCLLSDCGTPSFFDPGYQLVKRCRQKNISIFSYPGVSSLSALMPYLDRKTEAFDVLGFPPQKAEERKTFFKNLSKKSKPCFLLDTPYRLQKTIDEIHQYCPNFYCVFGINLTCENELVLYGSPVEIKKQSLHLKKENFVCMLYPSGC